MFIDLHVLQTVPPSNLNRDDTGSPKTALFGGVRRSRVSSQAWKRATRTAFADRIDAELRGIRTKRVHQLICQEMHRQDGSRSDGDIRARAAEVLSALKLKAEKRPKKKDGAEDGQPEPYDTTEYLIFLSARQIERLAELALSAGKIDPKAAKAAADQEHGVDVALFGRMVADDASLNVDAAVQVAHAISTHLVEPEQDYYTAVDDENPEEETGAGMIGTVEFNSATLYRYATINVNGLLANLGDPDVARQAIEAFVRAFVTSMPTGKQNTFANRTVPDAVVAVVREDQPVNLVGAFEEAVVGVGGYVAGSADKLAAHFKSVEGMVAQPREVFVIRANGAASALDSLGEASTLDDLLPRLAAVVDVPVAPGA